MAIFTVKNRYAAQPFVGMFDGETYVVKDTLVLQDHIARHLRRQSVFRDNPITGEQLYRLAIVEDGDDDTPLEELPVESLDRTDMEPRFQKVVLRNSGIRAAMPAPRSGGSAVTQRS